MRDKLDLTGPAASAGSGSPDAEAVRIVIDGHPVAKGRLCIGKLPNGRPVAFTPKNTRSYEDAIRFIASQAMHGRKPFDCPLAAKVDAFLPMPKALSRKKREEALIGALRPVTKPDCDNYIKLLDALNGIVFRDDSAIVEIRAGKWYSDKPRLEIEVRPLVAVATVIFQSTGS